MKRIFEQTPTDTSANAGEPWRQNRKVFRRIRDLGRHGDVRTRKPLFTFIPNVLTLCGMGAGITGIHLALNSSRTMAIIAILIAVFFDGIDGLVARKLGTTSRFGGELDSLSDFATFGVSPAVIVYLFVLHSLGNLGWGVSLLFAFSMALRLARFNATSIDGSPRPMFNFATGVPAPAAAYMALLPMIVQLWLGVEFPPALYGGWMVIVAMFMVSRLPTFLLKSGKRMAQRNAMLSLLCLSTVLVLAYSYPWAVLTAVGVLYACSIPVSMRLYKIELQKWVMEKAAGQQTKEVH
jgi:CDP-diacylglycerol--serine O-phosphatidyltransferase